MRPILQVIVALLVVGAALGKKPDKGNGGGSGGACVCSMQYDPVCGSDGRTYGNDCIFNCEGAGATIAHTGACAPVCICPDVYDPVCATDGRTYGNTCELSCQGQMLAHEGEC